MQIKNKKNSSWRISHYVKYSYSLTQLQNIYSPSETTVPIALGIVFIDCRI